MTTGSITPPAPGSPNRPRPSLIASNADARPRNESRNAAGILTSVEAAAGIHPAGTPSPKRFVLPLVLLAAAGVIGYALLSSNEPAGHSAVSAPLATTPPPAPTVSTNPTTPAMAARESRQSAVIETVAPTTPVAEAKGRSQAGDAASRHNPLSSFMAGKAPAKPAVPIDSTPASAKPAMADKPPVASPPVAVATSATIKARQDSDVDLITALVAHAEGRPIAIKEKKLPAPMAATAGQ